MTFKLNTALHYLAGFGLSLLFVLPLYWAVVASLGQVGAPAPTSIQWWMSNPQWSNYSDLFERLAMWRYLKNSLIVVGVAVPLTILTASMAGFAMSQLPRPVRRQLLILSVIWLTIPSASVWLFRFRIYVWLGLFDSLWALIAPAVAGTNPLFVLLFYWSFRQLPAEMFEAAKLDGAGVWTLWGRLAMPLARPTIVAVAVLSFVFYWSDFIGPTLYLFNTQLYTLPIGIQLINQMDRTNWPYLMAGAMIMAGPIILLFVFLQRIFLHDLSVANLFDRN